MSGPGEGKIKLGKADVYIHLKGKSGATVTHVGDSGNHALLGVEIPEHPKHERLQSNHGFQSVVAHRAFDIDIELPALAKIIKPGENSYVGGKEGGVFIGLKKERILRAETLYEKKE